MEAKLKSALGYSVVKATGITSSGCISEGLVFETDKGKIFVKKNCESQVMLLQRHLFL